MEGGGGPWKWVVWEGGGINPNSQPKLRPYPLSQVIWANIYRNTGNLGEIWIEGIIISNKKIDNFSNWS